jgi:DNA polymerase III subunit alpha
MAGVMNCDIHLTDKLATYKPGGAPHARHRDRAALRQPVRGDLHRVRGKIVYALGALKNVGVDAMRLVVEGAGGSGPSPNLFDFARRVD